ncbi:MAG: acyltransferase [Anaerolineae bacterium]|nr:acyltransferase [Anaerolineae bacterium]
MQSPQAAQNVDPSTAKMTRLYYLDWLRVVAILGVFLYHSVHAFDLTDWHIKNAEQSELITVFLLFVSPWGMPFFFLIAGTGTWFALRHRTARQYARERFQRLLIPFIFGCLLLTPLMLYFEWMHKVQTAVLNVSFWEFVGSRSMPISCQIFGWAGYHLWFLGFLFSFSLLTLAIFLWFRGEKGQQVAAWLAGLCEHRGGILLGVIPLLLIQLALRPFFPEGEHNWADFCFLMGFFVLGYLLYSDERFMAAIRRDWRLMFPVAVITTMIGMALIIFVDGYDWLARPDLPQFYLLWGLVVVNGWCWVVCVLFMGMRFLDFTNRWLQYGQEAILPFFVFHQPVIMVIAFFVVQWDADILPKLLVVVSSSFVVTAGIYELIVRHSHWLRVMFGMKSQPRAASLPVGDRRNQAHAR